MLIIENNNINNQQQLVQQHQSSSNFKRQSPELITNSETASQKIENLQLKFQQKQLRSEQLLKQTSPSKETDSITTNNNTVSENPSNPTGDRKKSTAQIEINNEGFIKNIPPNMLLDQYGMLGLSMLWQHKETTSELDKNISIIIGKGEQAKTVLKKSTDLIFKNKQQDIQMLDLTERDETEQLLNDAITYHLKPVNSHNNSNANTGGANPYGFYGLNREKLVDFSEMIKTCKDDLLFYFFYMCCKDDLQMKAYDLLCARNWFYHKEHQIWIKQVNVEGGLVDSTSNQVQLFMFDANTWEIRRMN
jgi:hypothetical protein